MKLPNEVPVMTLPNATLFPQALLPLYIFEPRYRRMLVDSLHSDRMFSVAMQRPGRVRHLPFDFAGPSARGTGGDRPLQAVSRPAHPAAGVASVQRSGGGRAARQ